MTLSNFLKTLVGVERVVIKIEEKIVVYGEENHMELYSIYSDIQYREVDSYDVSINTIRLKGD